jgi:DNA-binding GntR family transcriptional regulator
LLTNDEESVRMPEIEITRELLSDKVYDMIRASILDGSRGPGSKVVESEIARRLNVSQAPVREAVKRLAHEGMVTSEPRRGSFVTEISTEEFAIARDVRTALESVGACHAVSAVTDEDFAQLSHIVERMEETVESGDWAGFRTLDMDFHGRVLAIGAHAILTRMWAALEPTLVSQRLIGDPAYAGNRHLVVQWHRDLVDVLRAGDPAEASKAFARHASGSLGQE